MNRSTGIRTVMLGASAALAIGAGIVEAADTNQPISIATIDSSDADFIAYVYGGLLQRHGFNVEYLRIDYTAMIPALETGDLDVSTSIWDTTTWPAVANAMAERTAIVYGSTGVAVKEGWWYPKYLEEVCPGLPDYTALNEPDCVAALTTAETAPRGRYIDAPADWETDSARRMEALDLNYDVINSGSMVTMIASLRAAIDRKEPVFGFGTLPHWYFAETPGEFVQLPPNTPECYEDPSAGPNPEETFDCGFSVGFIWKMANTEFAGKSPQAARLLQLLQLDATDVARATGKIENDGMPIEEVAAEWLDAHEGVWSTWPIN